MVPEDEAEAQCIYLPGLYSWIFKDVKSIHRVPVKGKLGFFDLEFNGTKVLSRTACSKRFFRDEVEAAVGLMAAQKRKNAREKRYYRCSGCNGYHLTSQG